MARPSRPLRRRGQPRRLRAGRPRQRRRGRCLPLLDEHPARGLRARCATASSWARTSTSASSTPTRTGSTAARTSTAPASPTACSSTPTTTRPAGRPTCAPGTRCCPTARPRSTPRCCTTAGPSARSSTASTSARSTTRPTRRRRSSSTSGSPWRPSAARVPQVLPDQGEGRLDRQLFVNAADQSDAGEVAGHHRARPAVAASRAPAGHLERRLDRSYGFERVRDGARTQYEGPDVLGNAIVLRPRALHHASTSWTPTRVAWRRSAAARS